MSLLEILTEEMKKALKAQDKTTLSTVRLLISQLKNEKIDSGKELTPEDEINVLMSAAKKHKESIEAFQAGKRQDLVDKEQRELEIIQKYLPQQMSDEEVAGKIDEIITSIGAVGLNDLGRVMSEAMKELKGRADGKKVQNIVRSKLA